MSKDGLKPIGDIVKDAGELDSISPQERHHFTQADQVNQLVGASEADPDLGFMTRMMALCSLPRTNPGNRIRYVRRNGPYRASGAGIEPELLADFRFRQPGTVGARLNEVSR